MPAGALTKWALIGYTGIGLIQTRAATASEAACGGSQELETLGVAVAETICPVICHSGQWGEATTWSSSLPHSLSCWPSAGDPARWPCSSEPTQRVVSQGQPTTRPENGLCTCISASVLTSPHAGNAGGEMQEILTIAPSIREPGLVAYECRRCGHKTSVLQPADASREQ
jgi:hypothetical protein